MSNDHDTLIKAELYFKSIFLEKQQIENPNMYYSIHSTLLTAKTRTQQPSKAHYLNCSNSWLRVLNIVLDGGF